MSNHIHVDETKIIVLISRIHEKANAFLMAELARHGMQGLVPSHGDILYILFTRGNLAMNEIAILIHRKRPTVTVLVDKLAALGFVDKIPDPDDSRVTRISLTEKGKRMKTSLIEISENLLKRVYGRIKKGEREKLVVLLAQVNDNL